MLPVRVHLPIKTRPQPDETTCGPTCLHAVYRYWGDNEALPDVITRIRSLGRGGTVAVFLACDALRKRYRATIYTYNLLVFDPTWFTKRGVDIVERLECQRRVKQDARLAQITEGYVDFLHLGGRLRFVDVSPWLVRGVIRRGLPIIAGLSSTYLYRAPREYGPRDQPDDVRGTPSGHFVVVAGYDRDAGTVLIADPYGPHPYGKERDYWIKSDRVVAAMLLGMVTHDANLLVIQPPRSAVSAATA